MIKNFEPRLYQETILNTCSTKNTLVVLPTGMGKTNVFLMLASHRLKQYPNSKILFIGPTKPLIDQYLEVFKNNFEIPENQMSIFTGQVSPEKRQELWKTSKIIFSTPQGLENDIISRRINLGDVSLLGVDEAHRAVGDYAYVFVAKQYNKRARHPKILALTASPGSDMEKIQEVCTNLFIEGIEVRTDQDPDVKPYIKEIKVDWVKVDLNPIFNEIKNYLDNYLKQRFTKLKTWGILKKSNDSFITKKELLGLQAELRGQISSGEKDFTSLSAISVLAEVMKIYHAMELLETQGIAPLKAYFDKLATQSRTSKTKAIKSIMADPNYKSAVLKTNILHESNILHPKLIELQNILKKEYHNNKDLKAIIFNQYRDNALEIKKRINSIEGISSNVFVGQQKRGGTGLTQKEQKAMLDSFRNSEFNILIATSIGEEGLDVPKVDLVVFYEPIPSAIRQIQRRGRTGRQEKGQVIILMARNTRDEAYRWVAHHKERRMYRNLDNIKKKLVFTTRKENTLTNYIKKELKIYADYREKGSGVIKNLAEKDVIVKLESLKTADYILSSRVGIELKKVEDFVDSIIDGRLLTQLKVLKDSFERPIILIEGEQDIFSVRNIHANSIRGLLSTIAVSYGIPILHTKNPLETSELLYVITKREQDSSPSNFSPHFNKKPITLKEQQEYIISSLPGVGATLSKPLLKYFGSVKNVINASLYELQEVEKIGKLKASQIKEVVGKDYKEL